MRPVRSAERASSEASGGTLARRTLLSGMAAGGVLLVVGCSGRGEGAAPASPTAAAMTVHRDPNCGCCTNWAQIARKAGFQVDVRDDPDMAGVKQRLGVPAKLASCHTAEIGGFVIEGHVPIEQVRRLLRERPAGVRGLAVPGMPAGSPGMEMPDGTRQPFQVMAFGEAGIAVFAQG